MTYKDKTELINHIIELRNKIGRYMHDDSPDPWLALNLTIAQLKSLLFINYEGITNFRDLANALGVSPPNVTGIVERMVEQGLISREENPDNRRMQMLKVTAKGGSLLAELRERGYSRFSGILARLDEDDLAALARGLNALAMEMEKK